VRTKEPESVLVNGTDWPIARNRRPNQLVHILYRLDLRLNDAHSIFTIPPRDQCPAKSIFYNTVVLVRPKVSSTNMAWLAMSSFGDPPHLSVAHHIHCFDSLNRPPRGGKGTEVLTGSPAALRIGGLARRCCSCTVWVGNGSIDPVFRSVSTPILPSGRRDSDPRFCCKRDHLVQCARSVLSPGAAEHLPVTMRMSAQLRVSCDEIAKMP